MIQEAALQEFLTPAEAGRLLRLPGRPYQVARTLRRLGVPVIRLDRRHAIVRRRAIEAFVRRQEEAAELVRRTCHDD